MANKRDLIEKYSDDAINVIDDDIEKLKTRPTMYIGYDGTEGHFHLIKEGVQNSIDELMESRSLGMNCGKLFILYDEKTKTIVIEDDGRGIPHNKIVSLFTKIQASGKFDANNYSNASSGENGVGGTAINALSTFLDIKSTRLGVVKNIVFKEGYVEVDENTKIDDMNISGTLIRFQPNEKILGKTTLPASDIMEWIRLTHYSCKGIKITLHGITSRNKEIHKVYESKSGMLDYYNDDKDIKGKLLFEPIHIELEGVINADEYKKHKKLKSEGLDYKIDVVFGFDKTTHNENINSFCNYVNTVKGGQHVIGVRSGMANAILDMVKKKLSKKDLDKLNPITDDVRNGLYMVVNLFTKIPKFVGQNKEEVGNTDLRKPLTDIMYNKVKEILVSDNKLADNICKYVKSCAEMRLKQKHAKEVSMKELSSNSVWDQPAKLAPISDRKGEFTDIYEIFIGEGDSATGGICEARDPRYQAVYPLKGVPKNAHGLNLVKILSNQVFKDVIKILECGVGKDFDLNKLKYNKIIIATDADPDGDKIFSLLAAFFLNTLPEIVTNGHLYRVITPLYKATYSNKLVYIKDKMELSKIILKNMSGVIKDISLNGVKLTSKDMQLLLYKNVDYLYYLDRLKRASYVDEELIEYIVYLYVSTNKNFKTMKKKLESKYPFIYLEEENGEPVIYGSYGGDYNYIVMNDEFDIIIEDMVNLIKDVNECNIIYKVNGEEMSLGKLLNYADKYAPKIGTRLKGLGQLEPEDVKATLTFGDRKLLKLTMEDLEKTITNFDILHGSNMQARKRMMEKYIVTRDDLDT